MGTDSEIVDVRAPKRHVTKYKFVHKYPSGQFLPSARFPNGFSHNYVFVTTIGPSLFVNVIINLIRS